MMNSMRIVKIAAASLIVSAAILRLDLALAQQAGNGATEPVVFVEQVPTHKISDSKRFTARVEAVASVDLQARVTGTLRKVDFQDGQLVAKDAPLFEIEPDQLDALVASARAQLARAQANQDAAQQSFERARQLVARNTVSQATMDDARAARDVAIADTQIAQAALDKAKLDRSYADIKAPISGRIGRANFTQGNLVGPSTGVLARIVSLNPIRVAFAMDEGLFVTIRQMQAKGQDVNSDAFNLSLRLANGTDYRLPGRIEFIENEVDPQTGTVVARALFDNPDGELVPGQFVALRVDDRNVAEFPVVPLGAVLQDQGGRFVFVVGENNKVRQQRIETGARVDNRWAVTNGLKGGETLVVQGVQRLGDGMTVRIGAQSQPGAAQ